MTLPTIPGLFPPVVPFCDPFTRAEAIGAGISAAQLRALVEQRRVLHLLRGVYVDASHPVDLALRARAISLVAPPEAVIVDRTAAWLHGFDVLRRSSVHEAPDIEMFLAKDSRIRRPGIDSGRRLLLPRDVIEVEGLLVTTPLRTAIDLGRGLWRYDALGALDQYARQGLNVAELLAELPRFRGWRGVRQLRMLVPLIDARAESMAESALRLHWHDALLPHPEAQQWVYDDGIGRYRLDIADPRKLYAGEYDGEENHTSAEDRAHDLRRRAWCAEEAGWDIDVFTKRSVYGFDPHPVDVLVAGWDRAARRFRRSL